MTSETLTSVTTITGNFVGTDMNGTDHSAIPNGTNGGISRDPPATPTSRSSSAAPPERRREAPVRAPATSFPETIPTGIYAFGPGPVSISNNSIGTDVTGTAALGNAQGGVYLATAGKSLGSSTASGNLISGNGDPFFGGFGVISQSTASPGNTIKGNLIGTTMRPTPRLPNVGDGVTLGTSDTLGSVSDPNYISGNLGNGVTIPSGAAFCQVLGNRIGVKRERDGPR